MDGIESGYFDPDRLADKANAQERQILLQRQDNTFSEAWNRYHHSFKTGSDEVLDFMAGAFRKSVKSITPINLSGTIGIFKELGRKDQAKELLQFYLDNRDEPREFYQLDKTPIGGHVTDPDVRAAFEAKAKTFQLAFDAAATLRRIAENQGWNPDDIENLATVTSKQFRELFEESEGPGMPSLVAAALKFGDFGNASPDMITIGQRAREALIEIGKSSEINARRVRVYGIAFDAEANIDSEPEGLA